MCAEKILGKRKYKPYQLFLREKSGPTFATSLFHRITNVLSTFSTNVLQIRSYVLTPGVSYVQRSDQGRAGGGGTKGRGGSRGKRIAPGLCARFLARRRSCNDISNQVLSLLHHGPLLILASANSLSYAGTCAHPRTIVTAFCMNTNVPCPCGQMCLSSHMHSLGDVNVHIFASIELDRD